MAPGGRSGGRGRGSNARGYYKGRGFSTFTKSNKQRGACEALGNTIYSIGDVKQANNYVKTTEAVLDYV